MEIAVDAAGKIAGVRGQLIHETGAYVPWGIVLPWITATTVPGPYVIPHFKLDVVSVFTNKIQTTPVRGAGRPGGGDDDGAADGPRRARVEARSRRGAAAQLHPARRRCPTTSASSSATAGRSPTTAATIRRARRAALKAADYDGFRSAPGGGAPGRAAIWASGSRTRSRRPGWGRTRAPRCASRPPARSSSIPAPTPQGQSHKTTLAQIAAEQFGVDYDDVTVVTADTATISLGMGTFAARTAVNAGSSVHLAAAAVAAKAKKLAAGMMECVEDDLELAGGLRAAEKRSRRAARACARSQ